MENIKVNTVNITPEVSAGTNRLLLLAGPCAIESRELCLDVAEKLKLMCEKLDIGFVFKSSFDKANRSSINSYRGPGLEEGLKVLEEVKNTLNVPVVTDVHETHEVEAVAQVADILQIPAFLCRQTDLLVACAKTGRTVNIKKGQFLSPGQMINVVKKMEASGNRNILLTDRGTSFGYNYLISDFRCIPIMRSFGYPVVFDATHSVQMPGGNKDSSSGERQFVPTLAKAAVASGADALFLEVHPDPENAKSDGPNMLPIEQVEPLLETLIKIKDAIK